jgi:hypothetical protein
MFVNLKKCLRRNNSAWNQRFYVVSHNGGFTAAVSRREVEYALAKIHLANRNESAWNYLRVSFIAVVPVVGSWCPGM